MHSGYSTIKFLSLPLSPNFNSLLSISNTIPLQCQLYPVKVVNLLPKGNIQNKTKTWLCLLECSWRNSVLIQFPESALSLLLPSPLFSHCARGIFLKHTYDLANPLLKTPPWLLTAVFSLQDSAQARSLPGSLL